MRPVPPPQYEPQRLATFAPAGRYPIFLTKVLLAVIVVVYVGQQLNPEWIERFGTFGDRILDGEYFRIITGGFLHANLLHLVMNGLVAWVIGTRLEYFIGGWRLGLITIFALVGSAIGIVIRDQHAIGFSGVDYGWLAAWLGFHLTRGFPELRLSGPQRTAFFQMLGLNLLISIAFREISLAAHVGGFIGGFLAAFVMGGMHRPVRTFGVR